VTGQTQLQAGQTIGNLGLTVGGNPVQQASTQYQAGVVIGSEPPAGTLVKPGSTVNIVVSTGPPPPTTTTTSTPPTTTAPSTTVPSSTTQPTP
jgi:serine/threonine-protein kinase